MHIYMAKCIQTIQSVWHKPLTNLKYNTLPAQALCIYTQTHTQNPSLTLTITSHSLWAACGRTDRPTSEQTKEPFHISWATTKIQWQCVRLEHNRKKMHCSLALTVCLLMPFLCLFSYTTTGDAYSMYLVWMTEHVHVITLATISSLDLSGT